MVSSLIGLRVRGSGVRKASQLPACCFRDREPGVGCGLLSCLGGCLAGGSSLRCCRAGENARAESAGERPMGAGGDEQLDMLGLLL